MTAINLSGVNFNQRKGSLKLTRFRKGKKTFVIYNIFIKNSSLVTSRHNTLTNKKLRRDELPIQLITSFLIKDKTVSFPDFG